MRRGDSDNTSHGVGPPGDIVVERPVVGRAHIGDLDKTATAFIAPPPWRKSPSLPVTKGSRFYVTGDQVILRSQAIATNTIAAALIVPHGSDSSILAAFITTGVDNQHYPGAQLSPCTVTGEKNRRLFRQIGSRWTVEQLAGLQPSRGDRRAPATPTEQRLQRMWVAVLHADPQTIAADDDFLRLGSDSISAMRFKGLSFRTLLL
ncbi:uncharacterized protein BDW47DRAFT_124066 [Aspergillus candidus]|uniref:Carrier domain-containing protein n=1 Tax=Aspergillus candidus TaxID=41067 RepID=A0A2I2FHP0_ASPCN|nr:hypothetical protein BDW47DRAFT_124066 [Aspergillus candidus]PLB40134.1 hypothetical protein BDW47DRAFT_124066 [Aspergillus candidus]